MNSNIFRVGVAQMTSTDNVDLNLLQIRQLYLEAANAGANAAVFPENSLYFRVRSESVIPGLAMNGPEIFQLQNLVDAHRTALFLTTAVDEGDGKLSNSTLLFRAREKVEKIYSKIHLFDVNVEGAPPVRESDSFMAGEQPRMIELEGWKLGLSICYDLRFAELYLNYAQEADVILIPSAFLVPTGQAHWQVLVRARAIETQCFVVAPAQSGEHCATSGQVRKTYGHSLVVDPWGRIVVEMRGSPQLEMVELDKVEILKARRQIPMGRHRRLK